MISNMELIELVGAVDEINENIFNSSQKVEYFYLFIEITSYVVMVNFLGIQLWSSENDERRLFEEVNKCEPFEPFLRRVLKEELAKLGEIVV